MYVYWGCVVTEKMAWSEGNPIFHSQGSRIVHKCLEQYSGETTSELYFIGRL